MLHRNVKLALALSGALLAGVMASIAAAQPGETFAAGAPPKAMPLNLHQPKPVPSALLANPPAGDWLSFRRTLNGWAYSPLTQITPRNVSGLRLVWSRPVSDGGYEGTPLVHDGVMYIIQPKDTVDAVDAATGDLIWTYKRRYPEDFKGATIKRNAAIWENLLIGSSSDGYVYAVDITTGKQVWETKVTDYKTQNNSTSGGPIIADGKVISGRNCGADAGYDACVFVAHDARTGKELWRTHTMPAPGEPGDETWGGVPKDKRVQVGTWMPPTYDPELKLIYYGTSVTSPTPKFILGGNDKKHLYSTSTLAIDPETGKIVWYYQHVLDHWDFDHTFTRILLDTAVAPDPKSVSWINPKLKRGEKRQVMTGIPGKTGIVYTLDRKTGEFLWATPTVKQNVVQSIDGATGEVTVNPATVFTAPGQTRDICPSFAGGKNWQEGTYSPKTGLMYMPLQNLCSTVTSSKDLKPGSTIMGVSGPAFIPDGGTNLGRIQAISASTGKTSWMYEQRAGMMSLMSTAGGVVFAGDAVGRFMAFSDTSGRKLWSVNLASAITGYPVSYAVDGKQYVVIGTGVAPEAFSLGRTTPEYKPTLGNVLYVFALP